MHPHHDPMMPAVPALPRSALVRAIAVAALVATSLAAQAVTSGELAAVNAKEPGATTLPSGLVFRPLRAGTGASPVAADTVKVHYRGTLADGTEFDSSYKRNEPAEFPLAGVIPCWTEGVQRMKVGGKAKLTCPASIAYGSRSVGPIPPNSTLQFEVELLGISKR